MNKEKSSKSLAPASAAATSKTLVIRAKVLDVKKSNDDDVALKLHIDERSLIVKSDNVSSISSRNIDGLVDEVNDDSDGKGGNYYHWRAFIEKDDETKVSHVKHAKSSTHQDKKCLEIGLSKKYFKAKGATAKEAIDLDGIHKGDNVGITMVAMVEDIEDIQLLTLFDYVKKNSSLSKLETALKALDPACLVKDLNDNNHLYTLFAPNDDAFEVFEILPELLNDEDEEKGELELILRYHIVPGKYLLSDLTEVAKKDRYVTTISGQKLPVKIKKDKVIISYEESEIVVADTQTSNGVVHIMSKVFQ
jgi:uncharacterized surface protein with fasciclin (FAS1) repeats